MREIVHLQIGQCGNQIGSKGAASAPSSGQTTSSMPATTGPRATTRRGLSWWTR
uniref:Beta-tubulin n=1 Tax=Gadus morhua TaxID=8049 RepID=A0A8C5FUM0_GADMO